MSLELEDLEVYKEANKIADEIWNIVLVWDYFQKDTLGKQLVRAADSIAANLSEGFGRYHFKENLNFSYYSRGSLYETKTWLIKAHNRNLITDEAYELFNNEIDNIGVKLNNYIKSIGKTNK